MLDIQSSIYDLLNPCKISSNQRREAYQSAEASNYNPGQEIRISFPAGTENFDFSQSYVNMNIQLLNQIPEVPYILSIEPVSGVYPFADAGSFQIRFGQDNSAYIPFNSNGPDLETIISNIPSFTYRGFDIQVIDTGAVPVGGVYPPSTNTLQTGTGLSLVISNFDWSVLPDQFGIDIVNSNLTLLGVSSPVYMSLVQGPEYAYPRLDWNGGSLFSQMRVDIDSTTVININSIDVLSSICKLTKPNGQRYYSFETDVENFNGRHRPDTFRIKINFTDFINLFRQIIPMRYIGRQMRLYITLNQPNRCLIMKPGQTNGSYQISNFEFHYSRVTFHQSEVKLIKDALANNSLVLPFINYANYSRSISQGISNEDTLFNPSAKDLLGILAVMRPQSIIDNPQASRKSSTFLKNKIYSARLKIGSEYYPLDVLKSVGNDKTDVTEFVEAYLDTSVLLLGELSEDQRIFYNYSGNNLDDLVYIPSFDSYAIPTFVLGIQTLDVPMDHKRLCSNRGLSGADTSQLSSVVLELRGLELDETNVLEIFSIEQDYLVFGDNMFRWIK